MLGDLVPDDMSDLAMWAAITGFVSPVILNFIISALWPAWVKSLVALAWSAVVGTITALLTGAYEGLGIPSAILLTLVVSITAYQNFWKNVAPNMQRDAEVAQERNETAEALSVAAHLPTGQLRADRKRAGDAAGDSYTEP